MKQFIRFCIVGVTNTIISFTVSYSTIFTVIYFNNNISKDNTLLIFIASFLGFIISALNAFYWNNKFVFKKTTKSNLKPLLKSYGCYGLVFLLSFLLNSVVFTKLLNIPNIFIPVLQIFICTPLNFITNKFWAFK